MKVTNSVKKDKSRDQPLRYTNKFYGGKRKQI